MLIKKYNTNTFETHWHAFLINPNIAREGMDFDAYMEKHSNRRKSWGHLNRILNNLEIGENSKKEIKILINAANLIKKAAPDLRITIDPVENHCRNILHGFP